MADDFTNDQGQELLGKVWVELADGSEMAQTAGLLSFSAGIARRQSGHDAVLGGALASKIVLRERARRRCLAAALVTGCFLLRQLAGAVRGSLLTRRWRSESRANPSLKLVLIPGRLWVIPDRKSDVSCLE
jgi:hypothetical protein